MKMKYRLSKRSKNNLKRVHSDLVAVVKRAIKITDQDFMIICGRRTKKEQRTLLRLGKSWTMNSRHLTGHAVDFVPYPVDWNDLTKFARVADAFFKAADELGIKIRWGGDWNENGSYLDEIRRGSYDGGHIELHRDEYK